MVLAEACPSALPRRAARNAWPLTRRSSRCTACLNFSGAKPNWRSGRRGGLASANWWNIRWHLIEAARQMMVKGGPLSEVLLVPEPFRSADKIVVEQRRAAALELARPLRGGPRKL